MVRTQLYLPEDMHARLKRLAHERGTSISELVREALESVYAPASDDREWRGTVEQAVGLWKSRDLPDDLARELRRGSRLDALFAAEEDG